MAREPVRARHRLSSRIESPQADGVTSVCSGAHEWHFARKLHNKSRVLRPATTSLFEACLANVDAPRIRGVSPEWFVQTTNGQVSSSPTFSWPIRRQFLLRAQRISEAEAEKASSEMMPWCSRVAENVFLVARPVLRGVVLAAATQHGGHSFTPIKFPREAQA